MIAMRVVQQGIETLDVDAVVNAANDHLWMGGGEAVVTGAGRPPARHVIHAAVMRQFLPRTSADAIGRATASALARAEEIGAKRVAFPALGTGVAGLPVEDCARVMVAAVRAHSGALEEVVFAVRGDDAVRAFEAAIY